MCPSSLFFILSLFHFLGLWCRLDRPHGSHRLINSLEIRWAPLRSGYLCACAPHLLLLKDINHFQVFPLSICWEVSHVPWTWSHLAARPRPHTCLAFSLDTRIKWTSRRELSTLWWARHELVLLSHKQQKKLIFFQTSSGVLFCMLYLKLLCFIINPIYGLSGDTSTNQVSIFPNTGHSVLPTNH